MRNKVIMTGLLAAAMGFPALAQTVVPDPIITLDAPTISETEEASPEWYRKFTFDTGADESPVWQARPESDISLNWVTGKRWSLNIDLRRRDEESPLPREEMSAAANFSITPRFSVGGELSVGANELDDSSQWQEQQVEAGIRLQSAYKF